VSLHRFFARGGLDGSPVVSPADLHHLRDVLRLRAGDEVVLSDGGGQQAIARIEAVTARDVAFVLVRELPSAFAPHVVLVQGLSRGPRMDLVVEKATELGVTRIAPLVTARSVVKLEGPAMAGRVARWRKVAEAAAKQSRRPTLPRIDDIVDFGDVAGTFAGLDHVLVPWEETTGEGVGEALTRLGATSASSAGVVVGPEGGLEPSEVARLAALGAVPVTLGGTILRTETAGIVAVALVAYELGGLGGARRG
jgi:16S rRNA (uracil1498-N3)-methyltransferase